MSKKIVVFGANSFSGQDFVDLLLDNDNYRVIGVSRSAERTSLFIKSKTRKARANFEYHALDFNSQLSEIIALLDREKPSYIVNFAAQSEVAPSWIHPEHWFATNTVALAGLLKELSKREYLERYLHVSSPEVYGTCVGTVREDAPFNPSTPYAASKAAADLLLSVYRKQYNFPLLTVRATNVYGARQQLFKIIPRSVIYTKLQKKIQLHGGGQAKKSYIHIRDVSRGELAILERGTLGELYHLSPDDGVAVRDVVQTICKISNVDFSQATEIVAERPGQDAAYIIDSTKARSTLGWRPEISLQQGLEDVVKWVADYWPEISNSSLEYIHKA